MEWVTLGLFCTALIGCLISGFSILYALLTGLLLFLLYGRYKGFTWRELAYMAFDGVKTVKNILITFLLIGILTAFWRASGTIPVIVCYASTLIRPSVFLLMTFLLNCVVSVLTGTAFGTSATMGVICGTMASSMGVSMTLTGGAVLAGAYFGDRCSPVSTSALLVSELTKTNIFDNIKHMLHSALVPFLISCGIYMISGLSAASSGGIPDLWSLFGKEFSLHPAAFIPAVIILLFSSLKINVKLTMTVSILSSVPLFFILQNGSLYDLFKTAVFGFHAADPFVGPIINGGGILSMVKVGTIVCLSSSYSGIFQGTGLLDNIKNKIQTLSDKTTPFAAMLCTSCLTGITACNQTLTVMLTNQLCSEIKKDPSVFANDLEDSAIVIAPLIPWSIAGSVPLTAVHAPTTSLLSASYLYLLPVWRLGLSFLNKKRRV